MISRTSFFFSLFLILCVLVSQTSSQLPVGMLASRRERHHHFLWHNIRENWLRFSSETQNQIRNLGWAPPRPGRRWSGGNSFAINDNNSGEDFLFMHRQMISQVGISGWRNFPAPGDNGWQVPPSYTIPGNPDRSSTINNWKTSNFYFNSIVPLERTFTDPAQLRGMTLGELGARMEVTVHQWHHLRFSARSSYGYRPNTNAGLPQIDRRWDNPSYNWLVDSYSSHVNPIFYRIHGWIDARIEDWRRANGLNSIRWVGTWTGGPMSNVANLWDNKEERTSLRGHGGDHEGPEEGEVMQKLMNILAKEGVQEVSLADPVFLESPIPISPNTRRRFCRANRKRTTR